MNSYLIVQRDKVDENALFVVASFATRKEAIKGCKDLSFGSYYLLSVLRPLEVRESTRIVHSVVDWGATFQPRPRKATKATANIRKLTRAAKHTKETDSNESV